MRIFRTVRSHRPTFSDDGKTVNLACPRSWRELTQEQLHYVLWLLTTFPDRVQVKTYMLIRFNGIHVVRKDRFGWMCYVRTTWWGRRHYFTMQAWQIESLLSQLSYIDAQEDIDNRLEVVGRLRAVDSLLHGVSFGDYLNMEKCYQAFMLSEDDQYLVALTRELYRRKDGSRADRVRPDKAQLLGALLWYGHVKEVFNQQFPHFFKRVGDTDEPEDFDIVKSINVQIRALTDGDVTKEEQIYQIPCWRALTELDNKARESEEFNKKYNKDGK